MPQTRLFIDQPLEVEATVQVVGKRAHYASSVLRLRPNNEITAFDGRGGEFKARILSIGKKTMTLQVDEFLQVSTESALDIHLLQGLSKGDRMDIVVQKATELGVSTITPLVTEFSVVRLNQERAEKRQQRWRSIAIGACEQCGRNRVPEVRSPQTFQHWIDACSANDPTTLMLQPGAAKTLRSVDIAGQSLRLLIGPEGGFSDAEAELASQRGVIAVQLGPRVLRTETAALAALSALQSLHGDF